LRISGKQRCLVWKARKEILKRCGVRESLSPRESYAASSGSERTLIDFVDANFAAHFNRVIS
jgi:hypothetical protein